MTTLRTNSTFDAEGLLAGKTREALSDVEAAVASRVTRNGQLGVSLLDQLLEAVIPAVESQLEVLAPILEPELRQALLAARWRLGLFAEQLSRLAGTRQATSSAVLASLAESLHELLTVQQRAAHVLEQSAERSPAADLQHLLEEAEVRTRDGLLFVDPPRYGPTEAHALRHNTRSVRVLHLREFKMLPQTDQTAAAVGWVAPPTGARRP